MLKSAIKVGQEYVLREGKSPDAPLQRVKIIQHVRGKKWKAEWIDQVLGHELGVESGGDRAAILERGNQNGSRGYG